MSFIAAFYFSSLEDYRKALKVIVHQKVPTYLVNSHEKMIALYSPEDVSCFEKGIYHSGLTSDDFTKKQFG